MPNELFGSKCTAAHILLYHVSLRPDIEIKYVHRHAHRGTRIGDVHNASDVSLHWRTAQQEIHLVITIPVTTQILNHPQTRLAIRNGSIEVMLLPMLVDREALESKIPSRTELWFNRTRLEDGRLHSHLGHSVFNHGEFQRDLTSHFNRTAERDFPVSLGEVQITN